MSEIPRYVEQVKDRYRLTSDYALAEKLGIANQMPILSGAA